MCFSGLASFVCSWFAHDLSSCDVCPPQEVSVKNMQGQKSKGKQNQEGLCSQIDIDEEKESLLVLTADRSSVHSHPPEECVICFDEFCDENPVMNTLCECGVNKTNFHYSCLLLWLEKKNTCPSCSGQLYYQVKIKIIFMNCSFNITL